MNKHIQAYADTQSQFIEIVTRTLEGLAASQARTDRKIAETNACSEQKIAEMNARAAETDARLDRLAALVERNITGGDGNS